MLRSPQLGSTGGTSHHRVTASHNPQPRVNQDNIPQELKDWAQWVVWRMEARDGKPTKVPYNPKTPKIRAKANTPATWASWEKALGVAEADGFDGVGFMFSSEDPFAGIDLDGCRDPGTGAIEPWAREMITQLNSFTEISPSEEGVHILVKGKLPPGGRRKGQVEMYDAGRYFTITGQCLDGSPSTIEDRQAELEALHTKYLGRHGKEGVVTACTPDNLSLTDRELIEKAHQAATGEKFRRLWRGEWQAEGYPSPSEADLALCSLLAFWAGSDPARIDRLFRESGLMRSKWDRPTGGCTYGAITIEKALSKKTVPNSPHYVPDLGRNEEKQTLASVREQAISAVPPWPRQVMSGAAGLFAASYSAHLETPEPFLYMNYLTLLGHVISDKVTLDCEIAPQPRLYTVNLGESADTRKSTSISKTIDFFREALEPKGIHLVCGVGSAEGLARAFEQNPKVMLVLDELKALVQKMQVKGSVLLPCINTLFEANHYSNITKNHRLEIADAQICLMAASTLDTYSTMFTQQFLGIGFINRLFIVIGEGQRKYSIPQTIPENEKEGLREDLTRLLMFADELTQQGRYAMPITPQAKEVFDVWYFSLEQSVFTKRLDTYGHRLMPLLAINEMKETITPEIAERTVALLNYQLAARKYADPVDADNAIARLEERIRRLLANGPLKKRDLERAGGKHRAGTWPWDMAIKNLLKAEEIGHDHKTKTYWLTT